MILATLWWLFFWTALGLCLGSFLNVVIHRLPRQRSLREPRWSACPHCAARIRWRDNLPLVSYLSLGARCRHCREPISPRYPVIEGLMAVVVLVLLDAFFVGRGRPGLSESPFGLTEQLACDWPIFVAHVVLFACLLAMSMIDLEHYWVDIRFTNLATLTGFAAHVLWTPKYSAAWGRPGDTTAAVALFALAGLGIAWLILPQPRGEPHTVADPDNDEGARTMDAADPPRSVAESDQPAAAGEPGSAALPGKSHEESGEPVETTGIASAPLCNAVAAIRTEVTPSHSLTVVPVAALLLFAATGIGFAEVHRHLVPYGWRTGLVLTTSFLLLVWQGCRRRAADEEIAHAIHEERLTARRMVLGELALLLPAVVLAMVGYALMVQDGPVAAAIRSALDVHTRLWPLALFRYWAPLEGLATAAAGYVIAGALGWTIRIVFTLVFGKEAFGTGDIHLMAAAGCVAGWPVVVLGFFLTCVLAMIGWMVSLPFKRSRAIPLGPWLSLSFLIVVALYNPLLRWTPIARTLDAIDLLFFEGTLRGRPE